MNRKTTRIEPTLTGEPNNLDAKIAPDSTPHYRHSPSRSQKPAWQQLIESKKQKIQHAVTQFFNSALKSDGFPPRKIAIIASASLLFIVILWLMFSSDAEQEIPEESLVKEVQKVTKIDLSIKEHKVTLPDNFSIMTTSYQGVIIGWQGNVSNKERLWHIFNAQGDNSCQTITFNKGDEFPVLEVRVENSEHYFAYFSPTVTSDIIKAIALRSTFKLCGYEFSLSGSQATLGKNPFYSDFLLN